MLSMQIAYSLHNGCQQRQSRVQRKTLPWHHLPYHFQARSLSVVHEDIEPFVVVTLQYPIDAGKRRVGQALKRRMLVRETAVLLAHRSHHLFECELFLVGMFVCDEVDGTRGSLAKELDHRILRWYEVLRAGNRLRALHCAPIPITDYRIQVALMHLHLTDYRFDVYALPSGGDRSNILSRPA